MEVEFRKDLRCSYMVIAKDDTLNPEQYCIDLLEHQTIEGILPFERRRLDNKEFYYYEITGKQAMSNIFEKAVLNYDAVKDIFQGILEILGKAYDYLLPEDDFILSPEYIYMNIIINKPNLCYLPGFAKSIKKQMSSLLEYLMNKVDYNDKDAVLLIYQLYAVSREEDFTLDQLTEALHKDYGQKPKEKSIQQKAEEFIEDQYQSAEAASIIEGGKIEAILREEATTGGAAFGRKRELFRLRSDNGNEEVNEDELPANIPVMKEKIESETEVSVYPIQNLILSGICILIGVLLIVLGFTTGILYNSFGNRIDYSKLVALVVIILCGEGYGLKKLLDKKNKVVKVVKACEYVDPHRILELQGISRKRTPKAHIVDDLNSGKSSEISCIDSDLGSQKDSGKELLREKSSGEEEFNPTCLLCDLNIVKSELILKAFNELQYKDIVISSFPFFIGKLKENVDYCLEKDVISRYHAKITYEDNRYYITDLNSTNGTFINGEVLMTYQKKEIKIGDEIAFANIKYRIINE